MVGHRSPSLPTGNDRPRRTRRFLILDGHLADVAAKGAQVTIASAAIQISDGSRSRMLALIIMWNAYQTPKATTINHTPALHGRRRINPTTAATKKAW